MTVSYEARTTKTAPLGSGCLLLITTLAGAFILTLVSAIVNPVGHGIAAAVHCPGAIQVLTDEASGGNVRRGNQVVNTTIYTLTCVFADGTTKEVGNDTVAITAIVGGLLSGVVGGFLVGVLLIVWNRITRAGKTAST